MNKDKADKILTRQEQHKKSKTFYKAKELKLTEKQRKFCEYYVVADFKDPLECLDYADYNYKSKQIGKSMFYQFMGNNKVKSFIDYLENQIYPTLPPTATYQELIEFWSNIMRDETADDNQRMKASERLYKHLQADKDTTNLQNEYKDVSRMTDAELVNSTAEMLKRLETLGLSEQVLEKLQDSTE